jgi:hypothetical protein
MKPIIGLALVLVIAQTGCVRRALVRNPASPCVPTAPMPIHGLGDGPRGSMPVSTPRPTQDHMPIARLVPCYLADSLRVRPDR